MRRVGQAHTSGSREIGVFSALGVGGLARRATKFAEGTLVKCKIAYGECAFFQQKKRVEKTQYLVLDEADRMLVMGFAEEVMEIMEKGGIAGKEDLVENGEFVQDRGCCSVPHSRSLAKELLLEDYLKIVVDKIDDANKRITQDVMQVERSNKKDTLLRMVVQVFKQKTLIFVASKTMTDTLGVFISEAGTPTTTTHGVREQSDIVLRKFPANSKEFAQKQWLDRLGLDGKQTREKLEIYREKIDQRVDIRWCSTHFDSTGSLPKDLRTNPPLRTCELRSELQPQRLQQRYRTPSVPSTPVESDTDNEIEMD
ncbi:hypothetical protein PRIPAC_95574 [Pristionchus pacificus]|uniref:DEAD/DEAH-box helicase domain-containing protein n=1 Tax=Pristionchus pacificus TaxID=54126 RepID=A0A2A6B2S1_PRIPA|nr:hypothetical protein PRIPAC_95574 [Pristionchus pacificus]|eukprot:PDM60176.1 hypothetical protein PRIPAC_54001 [Pristionchus pacificus]